MPLKVLLKSMSSEKKIGGLMDDEDTRRISGKFYEYYKR